MKLYLLLRSILIFIGPAQTAPLTTFHEIHTPAKLVNKVMKNAALILKDSEQLQLIGTGSQVNNKIKMLALSFNYYQPVTEASARELLLKSIHELISQVNQDERIRHHLANYPFDIKNVEIRIYLYNRERKSPPAGDLSVISSIDGIFTYKIDDPKDFLSITHRETYEEAMATRSKAHDIKNVQVTSGQR